MGHNKDVPLEEKEQWLLDREAVTDAQQAHTKIERVIDHQEDEDGDTLYFIKCMCSQLWPVISKLTVYRARSFLRQLHLGEWGAGHATGFRAD